MSKPEVNVSEHTRSHNNVLLARQPILNAKLELIAYELLCRSCHKGLSNEQATADVLINLMAEVELGDVVGDCLYFINFTAELLALLPALNGKGCVIEVLENTPATDELIANLRGLKSLGYTIALDDFVMTADTLKLLPYADIVKLDVLSLSEADLLRYVQQLRGRQGIKLLAEKVEDQQMFSRCQALGFEYYQGYFFAKPDLVKGQRVKENKQTLLCLMGSLSRADVDVNEVERQVSLDPVLSYKLLRLVNSAGLGVEQKIESMRHALTMLGLNELRSWVMLLSLANMSDKPAVLSVRALEQARMCELLAVRALGADQGAQGFSLGLFALLDAFLDNSMAEILPTMTLSEELEAALLEREGQLGGLLRVVESYLAGRWRELDIEWLRANDVTLQDLAECYGQCKAWAGQAMASLASI